MVYKQIPKERRLNLQYTDRKTHTHTTCDSFPSESAKQGESGGSIGFENDDIRNSFANIIFGHYIGAPKYLYAVYLISFERLADAPHHGALHRCLGLLMIKPCCLSSQAVTCPDLVSLGRGDDGPYLFDTGEGCIQQILYDYASAIEIVCDFLRHKNIGYQSEMSSLSCGAGCKSLLACQVG